MTGKQVKKYFKDELQIKPKHNVNALADAITDMAYELGHDEFELLELLLQNIPIDSLYTHSYGFHTANGRHIIESIKEKYYGYEIVN